MSVHVFYPNKDNKVEFTKDELERLLKDVYNEGWSAGRVAYPWYINTTTPDYSNGNWSITTASNTLSNQGTATATTTTDHALQITYKGDTDETSKSN